jgi:hypothetical protein
MDKNTRIRPVEAISRPMAIARIRRILSAATDDEHCACVVAARYGVFCQGFSSLSDKEFHERFHWIVRKRPGASREELERLASLYHLGRQQVMGDCVCCDVETRDHCGCDGWNGFDNRTLEKACLDLTGEPVHIVEGSALAKPIRPRV